MNPEPTLAAAGAESLIRRFYPVSVLIGVYDA